MVKDAGFKTNVLIGCFSTANYDICVYERDRVCVCESERERERERERAFTATMLLFIKANFE